MKQLFLITIILLVTGGWLLFTAFAVIAGSKSHSISSMATVVIAAFLTVGLSKFIINFFKS